MTLLSRSPQIVLLFAGFVNLCHGSLHFLRGRPRGGMLAAPSADAIHVKDLPQDQWFTQRLDHFDDSNTKTWQQRYFYNDKFFRKPDGPVFLSIGGEGEARGGYSHTLPIRVCAAQRGRDFEAPDLERGIHFKGVF